MEEHTSVTQMKERVAAILSNPENHKRWQAIPVRPEKKKSPKADLNERSHDYMRAKGYWAYRADYFDHFQKRQHDFLGIFDFVCFGTDTVGMQITTASNTAARRKKLAESPWLDRVKEAGWKVLLLSWKKAPNGRWQAVEEWL